MKNIINVRLGLELRLIQENEAEDLYNLIIKNQNFFKRFLKWARKPYTKQKAIESIKENLIGIKQCESFEFGIYEANILIGKTGFISIKETCGEIGYMLDENFNGKGIMTDSTKSLINFAFTELNLNKIIIKHHKENIGSKSIPERLGFNYQGIETVYKLDDGGYWDDSTMVWVLEK